MADIFSESVVKRKPLPGGAAIQGIAATIAVITGMIGIYINFMFLIITVLAGAAWFLARQNTVVEFEYIHTNGDFDIDKVVSNSSRRRLMTVKLEYVEKIAPQNSPELGNLHGVQFRDYSGRYSQQLHYVMVYSRAGGRDYILLDLDEAMLKSLKKWMPDRVFTE